MPFVLSNKSRRAFSLMEFAIVLAVIGVVLASLWGVVGVVRENIRREEAMEQMTAIVGKIRDHYLGRACASITFSCSVMNDDLTEDLMENGVLLAEQYRNKGTTPVLVDHPWGGVGPSTLVVRAVGDGREQFSIEMNSLPRGSCVALAGLLSGVGAPSGLEGMEINGVSATLPVSPDVAGGACTNAGSTNMLLMTYGLRA